MSVMETENASLGYHLHKAFAALTEALNRELRGLGLTLTHPQFSIIQAVNRRPGLSQNELARETGKDSAAISRSLACLEKQGLVRRAKVNGCTKGVHLTRRGEELRPLMEEAVQKTIARACRGLPPHEVDAGIRILQKIHATLEDAGQPGSG